MPTRGLLLLAVVTMAAVAACWVAVGERYRQADLEAREGGRIFPALQDRMSEVVSVEVTRADARFTLLRQDGTWANQALGGFPAYQPACGQRISQS